MFKILWKNIFRLVNNVCIYIFTTCLCMSIKIRKSMTHIKPFNDIWNVCWSGNTMLKYSFFFIIIIFLTWIQINSGHCLVYISNFDSDDCEFVAFVKLFMRFCDLCIVEMNLEKPMKIIVKQLSLDHGQLLFIMNIFLSRFLNSFMKYSCFILI